MVCTANECRSPVAEHLMRRGLVELGLDWEVSSAGTRAVPGRPVHPGMLEILTKRGISPDHWSTRLLTGALIEDADLILTAEPSHRAAVVTARPAVLQRVFTLRQFARLAAAVDPMPVDEASGPQLVTRALAARSLVPAPRDREGIEDPMGKRRRAFERCARTIDDAVKSVLHPLRAS